MHLVYGSANVIIEVVRAPLSAFRASHSAILRRWSICGVLIRFNPCETVSYHTSSSPKYTHALSIFTYFAVWMSLYIYLFLRRFMLLPALYESASTC